MTNPFPGPRPYTRADANLYPGRREESRRVLDYVRAYPSFLLYGPSSSGKSSLMQAAVLPQLEANPHGLRTVCILQWPEGRTNRPSKHLLDMLSGQLCIDYPEYELTAKDEGIGEDEWSKKLGATIAGLCRLIAEQSDVPLVLYLDQLEQVFVGTHGQEAQVEALRAVDLLLANELAEMRIVLAIREDYVGIFRHRARSFPRLLERAYRLGPLTVSQMTASVCRAAQGEGLPERPPWAQQWDSTDAERDAIRALVAQMCISGQTREGAPSSGGGNSPNAPAPDDAEVEAAFVQIVFHEVFAQRADKPKTEWPAISTDPQEILHAWLSKAIESFDDMKKSEVETFLHAELIDQHGRRRIRTRAELGRQWDAIVRPLGEKAIVRRTRHEGVEIVELSHDWLAARLFQDAQKQARAAEDTKMAQEKADEDKRLALEAAEQKKRQELEEAAMAALEAKRVALEDLAQTKDKQKKMELETAAARSRRFLGGSVAVLIAILFGAGYVVRETKKEEQKASAGAEKQREEVAKRREQAAKLLENADALATISTTLLADGQFERAVQALETASNIFQQAQHIAETTETEQPPPPSLALGVARASTEIGGVSIRTILKDGYSTIHLVPGQPSFLASSPRGLRLVHVIESDTGPSVSIHDVPIPIAPKPKEASTSPKPKEAFTSYASITGFYEPPDGFTSLNEGEIILGMGRDGQRVVIDRASGKVHAMFRSSLEDVNVQVSRNGQRLLLTSEPNGFVKRVFLVENGKSVELSLPELKDKSSSERDIELILSRDGNRLLAVEYKFSLPDSRQWQVMVPVDIHEMDMSDVESRKWSAAKHVGKLWRDAVIVSPDGRFIASLDENKSPLLWSVPKAARVSVPNDMASPILRFSFASVDNDTWLIARAQQALAGWRLSETPTKEFEIRADSMASSVAIDPAGKQLLVGRADSVQTYALDGRGGATQVASMNLPEITSRLSSSPKVGALQSRATMQSPFFARQGNDWQGRVLTCVDDHVRVRALVPPRPDRNAPRDYLYWERGPEARPDSVFSLPLPPDKGPRFDAVFRDGSRIGILVDGQFWSVTESKIENPIETKEGALPFHAEDQTPKGAYVDMAAMKGGSNALIDTNGALRTRIYEKDKPIQRHMRPRVLGKEPSVAEPVLALSASGAWAATAVGGKTLTVWELINGEDAWTAFLGYSIADEKWGDVPWQDVTALLVGDQPPNSPWVIVGDEQGRLGRFSTTSSKAGWWAVDNAFPDSPHHTAITLLEEDSNKQHIVSAAADGTLGIWDHAKEGYVLKNKKNTDVSKLPLTSAHFAADGAHVILGTENGDLQARKIEDGAQVCPMEGHHAAVVRIASMEVEKSLHIVSRDARGVAIWWELSAHADRENKCKRRGSFTEVMYAGFLESTTNQPRFVTIRERNRIEIREKTGAEDNEQPQGKTSWGAMTHSGQIVFGDDAGGVFSMDLGPQGSPVKPQSLKQLMATRTFAATNANRLVVVGVNGELLAWENGQQRPRPNLPLGQRIRAAALSSSGNLLVVEETTGSQNSRPPFNAKTFAWSAWDNPIKERKIERNSNAEEVFVFAYAVNDTIVVVTLDNTGSVHFIDEQNQAIEAQGFPWRSGGARVVVGAANVNSRGSKPDRLILGAQDGSVTILKIVDEPKRTLSMLVTDRKRHKGAIKSVSIHPEGQFAVTVGDDGRAWLWDLAKGNAIPLGNARDEPIEWAVFDPVSGDQVYTGGRNNAAIRSWATPTRTIRKELVESLGAFLR